MKVFGIFCTLIFSSSFTYASGDTLDIIPEYDTANYYYVTSQYDHFPAEVDIDLVEDRLSCVHNRIPLNYNHKVHAFVNYFAVKDREYTRMVLRRKELYFPLFEKYLKKYGLPDELKYLSVVESGLNPKAISRARAAGLWQFMPYTGKIYDLHQDWYIDERMDPEKSTEAACKYLSMLYNMFGDWELAIAAYNTGPGNIRKAIRRSGYKRSFWEIYPHLYRETRSYLPQFVAIVYILNYAEEHNFSLENYEHPLPYDTIMVDHYLHLETLANQTNSCLEDIQKLNPAIKRDAIPDVKKSYSLKLPAYTMENLNGNRAFVLDTASKVGKKQLEYLARNTPGNTYGRSKVIHRVKGGDVLGKISARYGVRISDIKKWNNLRSNTIRVGQRLNIWLLPSQQKKAEQRLAYKAPVKPKPITDGKTYVVQPGDTLWDISRKFQGLSIERLKSINNLQNSKIKPGQKLIIG